MADTPGEGEAAQALFCAMADYVGVAKVKQVLNLENLVSQKLVNNYIFYINF